MRPSHTVWATLCVVLAASLVSARPSPEAEAGYSYKPPPPGLRLNYQPPWRNPIAAESRSHASEVTVEQVPIRLVQSRELPPPALSTANHRGAYYFPSTNARLQQEQHNQQYYRSPEQANQERYQQQNRGAYNLPASTQNQQQSYNNNGAQHQQQYYRQNEVNQQRGAYPQQNNNNNYNNNNNNYQNQYQRQQFQNQQQNQQTPYQQNNQQQQPQQQYQGQQGRSIDGGNNHGQTASGSNTGYQYNPANNANNNNVNTGYQYPSPSSEAPQPQAPQEEEVTTEATVTSSTSTELPRITIAISKSTVIHTGKGSYQIDEKTGKPKPIIAEAHSYAGVPEPTKKPETDDALSGEGTGNFPIIAKGTPPEDEEEEEQDTEANTEQPTTTPASAEQPNTPQPTAPSHPVSVYSSSWPYQQYGHHAHVVIAPGQTQYFALGTTAPMSQYYAPSATSQFYTALQPTQYIQPATPYVQPATQYVQQPLSYAHQYGAYHPSVFARLNSHALQKASLKWPFANYFPIVIRDPYASAYGGLSQILEYGPEADICRGKSVGPTAEAPAETPVENPSNNADDTRVSEQDQDSLQQPSDETHDRSNRMVIHRGGVAIAGPGGTADAGHGGTAIVGPGGTAYSSPNGISVVGPGGKVVLQGANSETILAKGPIIYYHKG